jgi:hypothetical protein
MQVHTMKYPNKNIPKGLYAQSFLLFIALLFTSLSHGNAAITDRAKEIVKMITGSESNFLGAIPAPEKAGLTDATLITFSDKGVSKTFVMLYDGETLILGNIININDTFAAAANQGGQEKTSASLNQTPDQESAPPSPANVDNSAYSGSIENDAFDPLQTNMGNILSRIKDSYDPSDIKLTIHDFRADIFSRLFPHIEEYQAVDAFMGMLKKTNQIKEGNVGNRIYVFYDPLCPYCVKEHKALRPLIDNGVISVSWIPVATASRPPYTYLLRLLDKELTNEERVGKLIELVTIRPPENKVRISDKADAEKRLVFNSSIMGMLRNQRDWLESGGTPQMILEKENGEVFHLRGAQEPGVIAGLIAY